MVASNNLTAESARGPVSLELPALIFDLFCKNASALVVPVEVDVPLALEVVFPVTIAESLGGTISLHEAWRTDTSDRTSGLVSDGPRIVRDATKHLYAASRTDRAGFEDVNIQIACSKQLWAIEGFSVPKVSRRDCRTPKEAACMGGIALSNASRSSLLISVLMEAPCSPEIEEGAIDPSRPVKSRIEPTGMETVEFDLDLRKLDKSSSRPTNRPVPCCIPDQIGSSRGPIPKSPTMECEGLLQVPCGNVESTDCQCSTIDLNKWSVVRCADRIVARIALAHSSFPVFFGAHW